MKKEYQSPYCEKISFDYKTQVVASNRVNPETCYWDGAMGFSMLGCHDKIIIDNGMNN